MTAWEDVVAYGDDPDAALRDLSQGLHSGELALLLGAGVSKPFGLPGWATLVRACLEDVGLPTDEVTPDAAFDVLKEAAGRFHDACNTDETYRAIIRRHLYDGHVREAATPLLTAVGALLMGSRRGRIRQVWTLNFDDLLEWHLRRHGFISQIITETPCLMGDVDVEVFHPHGFIPFDQDVHRQSTEIVFDDKSYATRSVGVDQPWRTAVQWALRSKVFVALGLSWTDGLLKALFLESSQHIKERPTAFWFFGSNDTVPKGDCLRHNVVPIAFAHYDDYAPFLLRVCEGAMAHAT